MSYLFNQIAEDADTMVSALRVIRARHCKHTPGKEENFERGIPLVAFQNCRQRGNDREAWCEPCIAAQALADVQRDR